MAAQALNAAIRQLKKESDQQKDEWWCHSCHGYFILPGLFNTPIRYRVQCVRNGKHSRTHCVRQFLQAGHSA